MTKWTCAHGFGLSEQCRECDIAQAKEVVAQWGDEVDRARRVMGNRVLFEKLFEGLDELERINRRRR